MLPTKSHLQLIIRELEKFNSELDKSYNFQEFFDRCRAIFNPKQQLELKELLNGFKRRNIINTIEAQNILYQTKIKGFGGHKVLRVTDTEGSIKKVPINISQLEYDLRGIKVWCHKQIIKMVQEHNINFEKIEAIDLK